MSLHLRKIASPSATIRTFLRPPRTAFQRTVFQPTPLRMASSYTAPLPSALATLRSPEGGWKVHTLPSAASNGQSGEDDPISLSRSFTFPTFTKAWRFMTLVAEQAKVKKHHPEWSNTYNVVYIRWTTHSAGSKVTDKDIEMAEVCGQLAKEVGEKEVKGEQKDVKQGQDGSMDGLADASGAGCDACAGGPKLV